MAESQPCIAVIFKKILLQEKLKLLKDPTFEKWQFFWMSYIFSHYFLSPLFLSISRAFRSGVRIYRRPLSLSGVTLFLFLRFHRSDLHRSLPLDLISLSIRSLSPCTSRPPYPSWCCALAIIPCSRPHLAAYSPPNQSESGLFKTKHNNERNNNSNRENFEG